MKVKYFLDTIHAVLTLFPLMNKITNAEKYAGKIAFL